MKWAALVGLGLLSGCNQGPDRAPLTLELFQLISQRVSAIGAAAPAARPELTRAALDTVQAPHIEVTLENNGNFAYLAQQVQRQDETPGEIVVWRSEDNVSLALRAGVLVATRGLGDDMLSASVLLGPGQAAAASGERRYQIRGLDNQARSVSMVCSLQDLGPAPVEIVEITYATRHLQERCEGLGALRGSVVVNDYWLDSRTRRIWQSRQWAGPTIGYLRIRQLTT